MCKMKYFSARESKEDKNKMINLGLCCSIKLLCNRGFSEISFAMLNGTITDFCYDTEEKATNDFNRIKSEFAGD